MSSCQNRQLGQVHPLETSKIRLISLVERRCISSPNGLTTSCTSCQRCFSQNFNCILFSLHEKLQDARNHPSHLPNIILETLAGHNPSAHWLLWDLQAHQRQAQVSRRHHTYSQLSVPKVMTAIGEVASPTLSGAGGVLR